MVQDPRTDISQEAFDEQYALAKEIWQELTRSHEAVARLRDVRGQIETVAERADDEAVTQKAEEIADALTAVEEKIHQAKAESGQDILNFPSKIDNQLLYLQGVVESAEGAPNPSSKERFAELKSALDGYIAELDAVIEEQVPEFEKMLEEVNAPRVAVE